MNDADRAYLRTSAAKLGVPLTDDSERRVLRYVEMLLAWNEKLNLTAVTEPRAIIDKHLLDSMAVVPFVTGESLLDVGTGPGLPSVILAICRPELRITAIESIHKKVTFVRAVSRELGLAITAEPIRFEQRPVAPEFDTAVSRATFDPSEWVERGAPWVRSGGRLIAMLSAQQLEPDAPPGFAREAGAQHELGGAVRRILAWRRST